LRPPDNRNSAAGNGAESRDIKADGLSLSSLPPQADTPQATRRAESDLTFEDRHSAWLAGFDLGYAQRVDLEIESQVQDALHQRVCEALNLSRRSAVHGPAFSVMVTEAGERP
jgi:hypothetical protein